MPFPTNQVYLRWEFFWQLGSTTAEIQDFGMWGTVIEDGPVFDEWQPLVDAIAKKGVTAWKAHFLPTNYASRLILKRCVAYHYDQPHLQVLHRGEFAADGDNAWSGSGAPMPPQTTVAVSTFAFDPAGYATESRSKRGRYYLPTPARTLVGDDGELDAGNQASMLTGLVAFHNDLSDVLDVAGAPPADVSHFIPQVVSPTKSYSNRIVAIRLGRIFDTQRRRRNKLAESYVISPVNG